MTKRLAVILILLWLITLWISFLVYQYRPFLTENHAVHYIVALAKTLAVLLVAGSLGLLLIPVSNLSLKYILLGSAVGLALVAILVFALSTLGLATAYAVWIALGGLGLLSYRQVTTLARYARSVTFPSRGPAEMALIAILVFASLVCLINCLAPLTANDSLVYHLSLPKTYASAHRLAALPYNAYANMPHYGEILYTLFYSIAGETGVKLFYFVIMLAAAASVYALAREFVDRTHATLAPCLFLVHPLLIDHRTVGNIDVMLAYIYLCSIILVLEYGRTGLKTRYLLGAALLAGFMCGIKYTALILSASLLVIPLSCYAGKIKRRQLLVGVLIALLVFAPWAVKNQIQVGNPLYPLLENVFDGANWDRVQESQLLTWQRSMGMGRGVLDYLLLPYNISVRGRPALNYSHFDGTISPILLILLPLALFRRSRQSTALIIMALAGFVFWALTSQQLRFLIPTLAVAAVLASIGVSSLVAHAGAKWSGVVIGLAVLVQISSLVIPDQYRNQFLAGAFSERLAVVTGLEPRQRYLERTLQSYSMCSHINSSLPDGEPVFLIWENRGYYLNRPYFADSFFEASTVMRLAAAAGEGRLLKARIQQMGYRYVLVNDLLGGVFSRYYPPEHLTVLRDLINNHLEAVHSANRLTLYRFSPR